MDILEAYAFLKDDRFVGDQSMTKIASNTPCRETRGVWILAEKDKTEGLANKWVLARCWYSGGCPALTQCAESSERAHMLFVEARCHGGVQALT